MTILGYDIPSTSPLQTVDFRTMCFSKTIPTANGTVNYMTIYAKGYNQNFNIGSIGIYDSVTLTPIANSFKTASLSVVDGVWAWHTYTYSNPKPTLVYGHSYYLGAAGGWSSNFKKICIGFIYQTDMGNRYSRDDGDFSGVIVVDPAITNRRFCIYIDYNDTGAPPPDQGPLLKIEGIIPGKLEYTTWEDLNTVR